MRRPPTNMRPVRRRLAPMQRNLIEAVDLARRVRWHAGSSTAGARALAATVRSALDGYDYAAEIPSGQGESAPAGATTDAGDNPLGRYFEAVKTGPGIWKWQQYFPAYHRHLEKFVGTDVCVLEVGVYSGGSIGMWRSYFGAGMRFVGIDIEPACSVYAADGVDIVIGDQADSDFWGEVVTRFPRIDVVIDDGGHLAHQQVATLKALLPHMAKGGVYLCEDVHGPAHQFHSFVDGLCRPLSDVGQSPSAPLAIHQHVASVHRYPLLTVIEKPDAVVGDFVAPKHGTEWQPFFDDAGEGTDA